MPVRRSLLRSLSVAAWAVLAGSASAQTVPYCNVTGVEVERLSNAVKITIKADGLMDVGYNFSDFYDLEAIQFGQWSNAMKAVTSIRLRIDNARSKVGSVADVGVYPASHVEISIPPESRSGVGLDLRVVLFDEAKAIEISTSSGSQIRWWWEDHSKLAFNISMTPDRRGLEILLLSNRQVPSPVKLRVRPEGAPTELQVRKCGDKLSVSALNADVREVLRELAGVSGLSIVPTEDLAHVVTLNLPAVTAEEALRALESAYGLSAARLDGGYVVGDALAVSPASYATGATEEVRLRNITAFAARASLPEFLLRFLRVDAERNALAVNGPKALIDKIRADLEKIDRPVPLIEIETQVVEFESTDDFEAALEADGSLRNSEWGWTSASGDLRYAFGGRLPDAFHAKLAALTSAGKAKVRGGAKTRILSGRTADLFVGRRQLVKVEYYDQLEGAYTGRIIELDLGLKLTAQAWSSGGEWVLANIQPAITSVVEREAKTGLPTVASRSANATLRIRNGETVVIGGLNVAQNSKGSRGISVADSLALLGVPLKSKTSKRSRSELAIFVTARLVEPRPAEPEKTS